MCLVPDGDLFKALREGRASVVTDHIETFTEKGIKLRSGEELEADVVVTATGLNLVVLGNVQLTVDGRSVDLSKTLNYKGMMFSDVPNLASAFGYTNASWTLKCDLTCEYVCRLLNHMRKDGAEAVHAATERPLDHRGTLRELHLRVHPALAPQVPEAGLEEALEAAPELRARSREPQVQPGARRRDGILAVRSERTRRRGDEQVQFTNLSHFRIVNPDSPRLPASLWILSRAPPRVAESRSSI